VAGTASHFDPMSTMRDWKGLIEFTATVQETITKMVIVVSLLSIETIQPFAMAAALNWREQ
jgi:hypothetical protein